MQHRFCGDDNCSKQNNLYNCSVLVMVSFINTFCQQRIATLTVTVIPIALLTVCCRTSPLCNSMFIILPLQDMPSLDVSLVHHHIYLFVYFLDVSITGNSLLKAIQQWNQFCSCWINGKASVHLSKRLGKYRTPLFFRLSSRHIAAWEFLVYVPISVSLNGRRVKTCSRIWVLNNFLLSTLFSG